MEEWRYIKGYNNKYQVSNLGRVRTVDRVDSFINSKGILIKRFKKGKILKSRVFSIYPYPVVYLNHHPKSVHRLVAETFIPNPDKKPCVNHIDANPKNNNLFNLEWCTYSENLTHAYKLGNKKPNFGETNGRSKLTKCEVLNIAALLNNGIKKSIVAKKYKVNVAAINDIAKRKSWKTLDIKIQNIDNRKVVLPETIEKRQRTLSKNNAFQARKRVEQFSIFGEKLNTFDSILDAEKITKVSRKSIRNSHNLNIPTCGFIWKIIKICEN